VGRNYNFIALEGEAEHIAPFLDYMDLEVDPAGQVYALGEGEGPAPRGSYLLWSRHDRGTLIDCRNFLLPDGADGFPGGLDELARASKSRLLYIQDLSTVICENIILFCATGELRRCVVRNEDIEHSWSKGTPLFDAGCSPWDDPDDFEYPEFGPERVLGWFVGFSGYQWSDRFPAGKRAPSHMIVTPVRRRPSPI
jgi:hypothetical protein